MEFNARKEMDKFILEKEEEYREVISYIGYSLFLCLFEEIVQNKYKANHFEFGAYYNICSKYVETIIKVLESITEQNKEKNVSPDTLCSEYYKHMPYVQSLDLTKYILSLSSEFECDPSVQETDISRFQVRRIIGPIIINYERKPLFIELLNKKLVQEFYFKISYSNSGDQVFSIDLDRYFDSMKEVEDREKIKTKYF